MLQQSAQQLPPPVPAPPAAPGAPAVPAVPGATIVTPGALAAGPVLTTRDIQALRARRTELSRQLNSADGRRQQLHRQLLKADGADKAGLEQRLGVLDTRIASIEGEIEENGHQLASLPASMVTSAESPAPFAFTPGWRAMDNNFVPIAIVFTLFVLSPISLAVSRLVWRRSTTPRQPAASPESSQRLERMEQAMDAIAIEIERVSEGQRFVTRILSEGRGAPALNAAQPAAEPVAIPVGERVVQR